MIKGVIINAKLSAQPGCRGLLFFTVNLLERYQNNLLIQEIELLRKVVKGVKQNHPFHIDGWVVLPEHMHFILTLPKNDDNYAKRIRLIKAQFSKQLPKTERRSNIRKKRNERGIWQRRYWEHTIRDDKDYATHMDYLHYNPVKHGYVESVKDWPFSTFHRLVKEKIYHEDWGAGDVELNVGEPGVMGDQV